MKYNKYDTVFSDGGLTQLMIVEKAGKQYQPKRLEYPIYKLLKSFLNNYGIGFGGAVMIGEYQVRAVFIDKTFDLDNEPILRQLYSFTSGTVNIQLTVEKADGKYAMAIDYNLKDYSCTLQKYVNGATVESTPFVSLAGVIGYLKENNL